MQTPYTQQAYGQYPSTQSHNTGSGYPSHPGATDFMTPDFSQRVSPSYTGNTQVTQPYTTDIYRDQLAFRTGPGYGNGVYGGSLSEYGTNPTMAGSWGTPAPQPLQNSNYSMPYNNIGQNGTYYAGYRFNNTEQVPGPTMNFTPHLLEANVNQDASSEWRFHTCWVSHSEEDKIHFTIALKKT